MLHVHASGRWKVIAKLSAKVKSGRLAAVAYLTSEENVEFDRNDVLIVDASDHTIASGGTSAKLLKLLLRRGVRLYSAPGLHAKVYLFDQTAVVGSANLSKHSMNLIEAAVVTDRREVVAGVSYLIESLRTNKRTQQIDEAFVLRALSIPVLKMPGPKGEISADTDPALVVPEARTWLTGLFALDEGQFPSEQASASKGSRKAAKLLDIHEGDVEWIRYPRSWRFAREARAGDNVIQVWRESHHEEVPSHVYRATPIAMRQEESTCVRFFVRLQQERVTWRRFVKQWEQLGYASLPGINAERLLSAKSATLLDEIWE